MSRTNKVLALREGGNVRRAHTIPHRDEYTVGKHSYDVACIILALHPSPSAELLRACLLHDVPERWVGDIPATAKWYNIRIGEAFDEAERAVQLKWDIEVELNEEDLAWLHAADRVEFWLWCHDQLNSGNLHVQEAKLAVEHWMRMHWEELPLYIQDFVDGFEWQRLPELKE